MFNRKLIIISEFYLNNAAIIRFLYDNINSMLIQMFAPTILDTVYPLLSYSAITSKS